MTGRCNGLFFNRGYVCSPWGSQGWHRNGPQICWQDVSFWHCCQLSPGLDFLTQFSSLVLIILAAIFSYVLLGVPHIWRGGSVLEACKLNLQMTDSQGKKSIQFYFSFYMNRGTTEKKWKPKEAVRLDGSCTTLTKGSELWEDDAYGKYWLFNKICYTNSSFCYLLVQKQGNTFTKGNLCPDFRQKKGEQRVLPLSVVSQLTLAQNPYARATCFEVAYVYPLNVNQALSLYSLFLSYSLLLLEFHKAYLSNRMGHLPSLSWIHAEQGWLEEERDRTMNRILNKFVK